MTEQRWPDGPRAQSVLQTSGSPCSDTIGVFAVTGPPLLTRYGPPAATVVFCSSDMRSPLFLGALHASGDRTARTYETLRATTATSSCRSWPTTKVGNFPTPIALRSMVAVAVKDPVSPVTSTSAIATSTGED